MKSILFWIIKITGFLADLVVLKRKVYYENRSVQKRSLKGGYLIVANHKSWIDYIVLMFVFFFRKVRPVVAYDIYHKNKVLTFFLDVIGAIPLGEIPWDPSFIQRAVAELRRGHSVAIFPEAHFVRSDEFLEFGTSYLRIASEANVPILPFYTDGVYSFFHRNRVMIGEPYYLSGNMRLEGDPEKIEAINKAFKKKLESLRDETKKRCKNPLLSFKNAFMDLGRFFLYTHFGAVYRVHVKDLMKYHRYHKIDGPFVLVANHVSFADPLVTLIAFWRRRMHLLIAKEVYADKKVRSFGLNHLGGIKIDRSAMDINAINECVKTLNRGRPLVIFAQGYIERSGELTAFKEGPAMIAATANVPILPVYIYPRRYYQSHYLYVGEFIYPEGTGRKAIKALTEKTENAIKDLEEFARGEKDNGKK